MTPASTAVMGYQSQHGMWHVALTVTMITVATVRTQGGELTSIFVATGFSSFLEGFW